MNNEQVKQLCLSLMTADTERDIISILKQHGYWERSEFWRYYGDKENNYSAAGNQADEAEAALVEKITNSRDAILMNECWMKAIEPKSDEAPSGVKEAVAEFFEENPKNELAGQIKEWSKEKRREIAKNISVYITGNKPAKDLFPCINIADKGEGQTPLEIPNTILSLGESIKRKIPFVHGKWNMGGTAALVYCGKANLQLIVSRRNQQLIKDEERKETDNNWGFTIVRREDPVGKETSSTYKYLAPVEAEANPGKGELLNFNSNTFPIFAKYNEPYSVKSEWGTLVKLYEYETRYKQNVQGSGGLLRPLDLLAPDLGLPFRLHECRYEGTPGSFEHQVNGLRVRLYDDRGNALEPGYPTSHNTVTNGEPFSFSLYAFKDDKAKTYRDSEKGVIFTLNGQSQGWFDDRIFTRNKVSLGFLKNSLLLIVDCSGLSYRAQEKLFVNDRVHIRKGPYRDKIEDEIIDYLANHQGLSDLQEERKRQLQADKLDDSKPLETVLSSVFKHSSALSKIFLKGQRLSNAFRSERVEGKNKDYKGLPYPTYFKFKKLDYGKVLARDAFQSTRSRIGFETDAENDYLIRKTNPGSFKLFLKDEKGNLIEAKQKHVVYGLSLLNGIAIVNIDIDSQMKTGDKVRFMLEVTDPMRIAEPPFQNEFVLTIYPKPTKRTGGKSMRSKPPTTIPGKDRDKSGGVKFPKIYQVNESEWGKHEFNKFSAMRVVKSKINENGKNEVEFTFYVNIDNIYLQHEVKDNIEDKKTTEAYFKYGMALLGISIIYDDQQNKDEQNKYEGIEERIAGFSRAMGPMIIPMIKEFGDLDLKDELLEQLAD
ncbi:MAG: hypothetical protein FVQ77_04370 [Cytophagales bacterium]|nr:hypothetical protein [Cytophagales bacterium]